MPKGEYKYVIIGGGLAGASAIGGIRKEDKDGSILLIGKENHLPYNRPPLSKDLWFGKKEEEEIFINKKDYYKENDVDLALNCEVVELDPSNHLVTDREGVDYQYKKLLIATGGEPKRLDIPGGDLEEIFYYRYLDDYRELKSQLSEGDSALIIGGGFIGAEMAAALATQKVAVTMVFPESYLLKNIFPEGLGRHIQDDYQQHGIQVLPNDLPISIKVRKEGYITETKNETKITSDLLIGGIGISPSLDLALSGGLKVENGISVNKYLQTSNPDVYAAGDNAYFPYSVLNKKMRIEHWDNALSQGEYAGRNMTGAKEPFTYMPYFYSDLFDFGFEAVGEVDTKLEMVADWKEEYKKGVIYYLKEGVLKGAMLCNLWGKKDRARELIKKGKPISPRDLRGTID